MKDVNVNRPLIPKCWKRPLQKRAEVSRFQQLALDDLQYEDSLSNLERMGEKVLRQRKSGDEQVDSEFDLNEIIQLYREARSLETGEHFLNGIDAEFRGMAIVMFEQLVEEFKVTVSHEKAYLQMAIAAFCHFQSNMVLVRQWKPHGHKSLEKVAFLNMLTKQADRSLRQYHTILRHFEMKMHPPLQINVKAQNAIVAQNQQFNNNHHENIEA